MINLSAEYCANINISNHHGGFFEPIAGIDWSYKTHVEKYDKFYYITDGECEIVIEGTAYNAKAGEWFYIPAGVMHSYKNDPERPFKKYWIEFAVSPDPLLFSKFYIKRFVTINSKSKEHTLFKRYTKIKNSNTLSDSLEVKSIIIRLLSSYLNMSETANTYLHSENDLLFTIREYLEKNMNRPVTGIELSELLRIHPTHLIRKFKRITGQTPKEYIQYTKMERAKQLLLTTDCFIEEISERVGYYDPSAFSNAFKKFNSLTPKQYRKMYKNQ